MTDRELLQDALDALTYVGDKDIYSDTIDALRARLAQPENKFNPDWDAIAVMVEEQQRMAKRIEELEARLAQPEQEPVAWVSHNAGLYHGKPDESLNPLPLYTTPPQREWQGLTDEEVMSLLPGAVRLPPGWVDTVRAIEAKLKEKNG